MDTALFYFKSKKYAAALNRFALVMTAYPDFGLHQQALDYMGQCRVLVEAQEKEEEAEE
jgi:outer membrane protein assembly factor BamD